MVPQSSRSASCLWMRRLRRLFHQHSHRPESQHLVVETAPPLPRDTAATYLNQTCAPPETNACMPPIVPHQSLSFRLQCSAIAAAVEPLIERNVAAPTPQAA